MRDVRPDQGLATPLPTASTLEQRRIQHLLGASPEAVLLTDEAGGVVAANPAACTLLRRTQGEICEIGRLGLTETADPQDSTGEQYAGLGQCVEETTLVRGDGSTFAAQVFFGAALCHNGASALTPMFVRDLSAQRADEAELEEYRRRFEDLLKERAEEMREAGARVRKEADERRHAEAEAQASEERFRMLVERSSDLILIVDGKARVTYCSPSVERLTGYRQDEVTGMVADKLIHHEDLAQIAALRSRHSPEPDPEPDAGTLRIRTKDGLLRWFEWSASSHLEDEATCGIVVNARDVTDRFLAERALRASEERYRTLTEASPDMIYVVGLDGCVQYVNGLAAQRFGAPAEKLIGAPLARMFEGATAARTTAAVEGVLASGEPYETESAITYPDGELWVSTRLVALKDDGRISSVLGVSHDITERKLAQDALAESERRYRSLFEDSPVAMWEEDHSAVKLRLEQLVASGVSDVVGYLHEHPEEYQECVALIRQLAVNEAAVALCEAPSGEELIEREAELYPPGAFIGVPAFWAAMLAGKREASYE
jgi:PAS domain S-box-containing protein